MYENGMGNGPRATPTVSGQQIYAMTGEGILVALARADGTKQQTPVLHEGHLYGLDNSGSAGPITNLVCIRGSNGKTRWKKSASRHSSAAI